MHVGERGKCVLLGRPDAQAIKSPAFPAGLVQAIAIRARSHTPSESATASRGDVYEFHGGDNTERSGERKLDFHSKNLFAVIVTINKSEKLNIQNQKHELAYDQPNRTRNQSCRDTVTQNGYKHQKHNNNNCDCYRTKSQRRK